MPNNPLEVLITGGFGFVGNNLTTLIRKSYADEFRATRFSHKTFDLTKKSETNVLFKATEPDIVIHLASRCGGIGANQKNPASFWADTLRMGMNVLDACVEHKVKKLVTLGTVCSYPKIAEIPFKEEYLCTGWPEITNRPYGIAKLALYEGCRAYGLQHELQYTYLVPTNMYGPHDNFDLESGHVIPAIIQKFHTAVHKDQSTVELWGDGTPTRDFLFAEDCARAIIMAIGADFQTEPINLGSGQEVTMSALVEMIRSITGYEGDVIWNIDKPNGQPRRAVDATRARNALHWQPTVSLYEGLKRTYGWFLNSPFAEVK